MLSRRAVTNTVVEDKVWNLGATLITLELGIG